MAPCRRSFSPVGGAPFLGDGCNTINAARAASAGGPTPKTAPPPKGKEPRPIARPRDSPSRLLSRLSVAFFFFFFFLPLPSWSAADPNLTASTTATTIASAPTPRSSTSTTSVAPDHVVRLDHPVLQALASLGQPAQQDLKGFLVRRAHRARLARLGPLDLRDRFCRPSALAPSWTRRARPASPCPPARQ